MTYRIEFEYPEAWRFEFGERKKFPGGRQILAAAEGIRNADGSLMSSFRFDDAGEAIRAAINLNAGDNGAWQGTFRAIDDKGKQI